MCVCVCVCVCACVGVCAREYKNIINFVLILISNVYGVNKFC